MIISIVAFIFFLVIFGSFVTAIISASRYKYKWHSYCKRCDQSVADDSSFCVHCGDFKKDWKGTRILLKSGKYEYR